MASLLLPLSIETHLFSTDIKPQGSVKLFVVLFCYVCVGKE
uniref:Uncharacterized protein n=1 Tax=Anguilla anguilla TaxID=7936 RepID=A0A0E9RED3_ANGAN